MNQTTQRPVAGWKERQNWSLNIGKKTPFQTLFQNLIMTPSPEANRRSIQPKDKTKKGKKTGGLNEG